MENLNNFISSRIDEKLKITKESQRSVVHFDEVPDDLKDKYGITMMHFKNASAAFMFEFEMSGQLSDGKYENARPYDHWKWVVRVVPIIDGDEYCTGKGVWRKKRYNLREWTAAIKDIMAGKPAANGYDFAIRLYDYAKIGAVVNNDEYRKIVTKHDNRLSYLYGVRYVAELFGDTLRKDPEATFADVEEFQSKFSYMGKYLDEVKFLYTEDFFERFKSLDYTLKEFLADEKSMEKTVNTIM